MWTGANLHLSRRLRHLPPGAEVHCIFHAIEVTDLRLWMGISPSSVFSVSIVGTNRRECTVKYVLLSLKGFHYLNYIVPEL